MYKLPSMGHRSLSIKTKQNKQAKWEIRKINKNMLKIILIATFIQWQVNSLPLSSKQHKINEVAEQNVETAKISVLIDSLAKANEVKVEIPRVLSRSKRNNGMIHEWYRWPNATVPVIIDTVVISEGFYGEINF